MRRPGHAGLLAGAALLVFSLYLSWLHPVVASYSGDRGSIGALEDLFAGSSFPSPWDPELALFAILTLVLALVVFLRPARTDALPVGFAALGSTFLAVACLLQQHDSVRLLSHDTGSWFRPAFGLFVAAAGVMLMLTSTLSLRRDRLTAPPPLDRLIVPSLGVALLVALLLPWERYAGSSTTSEIRGVGEGGPGVGLAILALVLVTGARPPGLSARASRLVLPTAAAVLAGGMFAPVSFDDVRAYGAWIGLGLAIALVIAALLFEDSWPPDVDPARARRFAVLAGAGIVLFLPWEHGCYPATGFGRLSGQCQTVHGWFDPNAALVLVLLGWAVAAGRPRIAGTEVAVAAALLVSTVGFELSPVHGTGADLGWGAVLGYVLTGLVVVPTAAAAGARASFSGRLDLRLVPLVLCGIYLAFLVVPWWDVFSIRIDLALRFDGFSWLMIPCALAAIRLARLWWERVPGEDGAGWLTFLSLFLFSIAAANAVSAYQNRHVVTWGEGAVLLLATLLTLAGWLEEHGGLANLEVPEILRIDRI